MKLWIRSQDKETLKLAEMLDIYDLSDDEGQYWVIEECGTNMGYYKSKERALEVLDEIQNTINAKTIIKFKNFIPQDRINQIKDVLFENSIVVLDDIEIKELAGVIVYQMPKE